MNGPNSSNPSNKLSDMPKKSGQGVKLLVVAPVAVLVILLAVGVVPRLSRQAELSRLHDELSKEVEAVDAVIAQPASHDSEMMLPGNIIPIQDIPIYARVPGYLKERLVDIGDVVKKDQLLAVIDTPELDQQIHQAEADLRQAKAQIASTLADRQQTAATLLGVRSSVKQARTNLEYSTIEYKRYQGLSTEGAVSFEQRDNALRQVNADTSILETAQQTEHSTLSQVVSADAKIAAAKEMIESNQANLNRLRATQGFQKVLAPSDGVITNRLVDAGALISAGGSANATQLMTMARTDKLRIYVDVPQSVFRQVHVGSDADILVQEYPNRVFKGKVGNIAGALNSQSRTLQAQIIIDNADHILPPGVYAQVRFQLVSPGSAVLVPSNALVYMNNALYVEVVKDGRMQMRKAEIGRDFGSKVELSAGVKPGEIVLLDPPDQVVEGQAIKPILPDVKAKSAS